SRAAIATSCCGRSPTTSHGRPAPWTPRCRSNWRRSSSRRSARSRRSATRRPRNSPTTCSASWTTARSWRGGRPRWSWRRRGAGGGGGGRRVGLPAGPVLSPALIRGEQSGTRAEQGRAGEAYQRERQGAEEAEAQFRLARRSVNELIQVSEEELADRPGMEGVRKRLLRSALAYYQEFIEQRRDDPGAPAELLDTPRRREKNLADLAVLRAASKLYLLCQPAVLDDLGLNEEQRGRMKKLTARVGKQWRESFQDIGRTLPAERWRRAIEQARDNEADVNAILT